MRMAWGIRGLTYWTGKIYAGVHDGRLFALDAKTGALVWETQTTEPDDNRYITGAPRVLQGSDGRARVIIGHGGADFGHVRGYVTTYDAATGAQIGRSVGSGKRVSGRVDLGGRRIIKRKNKILTE